MWSVVVLPLVFTRIGRSTKSLPSHLGNGARSWSRSLSGFTITWTDSGSSAGASKPSSPPAKPSRGSSSASGAGNRKGRPPGPGGGRGAPHAPGGGVRAGADERVGDPGGPAVRLHLAGELRDGAAQIRRVRADDVRLELVQIDLDELVVEPRRVRHDLAVGHEAVARILRELREVAALGGA